MNKLNSPLFMFHAAKDFFEKGTTAASDNFKAEENEVKQFDSLIHPKLCMPIVNIVFSLELILKGLAMQSRKKPLKTHNLLKLFDYIDSDLQRRIIDHYQTHDIYKKYLTIRLVSGDGSEHSKRSLIQGPSKDKNGILAILESHKNYFEDFRYLFEYDESKIIVIWFRQLCNLSFSALYIFGEILNLQVVSTSKRKIPVNTN